MENRASFKDKYKNIEKKGQTKPTESKTQKEHPPLMNNKHTKDKNQKNINNQQVRYKENMNKQKNINSDNKNLAQNNPQQKNNHLNQEKIGISQKNEYIPYSCIPQLETNDHSFPNNQVQR